MNKLFKEESSSIPVYDECDVLVIGGGAAGHSAAIAAARACSGNGCTVTGSAAADHQHVTFVVYGNGAAFFLEILVHVYTSFKNSFVFFL